MKRVGFLIEKIADIENLRLAFWKARKGKDDRKDVILYRRKLDENLLRLQEGILTKNVEVGHYHFFTIYDPKERQICAAPFEQRVLHHALMNICDPYFEKYQIYDSYATRKGKGTYAALDRAKQFTRKNQWFLKLDVRHHFENVNHHILKDQLARQFKDSHLLFLFHQIIESYAMEENRGLPIGNLTSQYFANHFLAVADHHIKGTLRCKAYVRYMDDMVIWHKDKKELLKLGKKIKKFIAEKLDLSLKPFCLNRSSFGLPFLGYLIFPDKVRLAGRSKKRFLFKLKKYEKRLESGLWSQEEYQAHMLPLVAFTKHAGAVRFRKEALTKIKGGN